MNMSAFAKESSPNGKLLAIGYVMAPSLEVYVNDTIKSCITLFPSLSGDGKTAQMQWKNNHVYVFSKLELAKDKILEIRSNVPDFAQSLEVKKTQTIQEFKDRVKFEQANFKSEKIHYKTCRATISQFSDVNGMFNLEKFSPGLRKVFNEL